jgi:hypothetical protein
MVLQMSDALPFPFRVGLPWRETAVSDISSALMIHFADGPDSGEHLTAVAGSERIS